ncbi:MAG: PEP-CTERM sorting domain-containing protein [Phycisphaerae bacterium]
MRTTRIVVALGLLLTVSSASLADTLYASLRFTVPAAERPVALSYCWDNQTWEVLYGDTGRVRFFSATGTEIGSYMPDLSPLTFMPSGFTAPRLADIMNTGTGNHTQGLVGNPTASLPPTFNGTKYVDTVHIASLNHEVLTACPSQDLGVNSPLSAIRIEFNRNGSYWTSTDKYVALLADGHTLAAWEQLGTPYLINLQDHGISAAQSVTSRYIDGNAVVLHDNVLTVVQRYVSYHRQGGDHGVPLASMTASTHSNIGDQVAEFNISGLPGGASLVDVENVFAWGDPWFADQDRYFVLDQTTGGVYALVPEPATTALLALGGLTMLLRRRGR